MKVLHIINNLKVGGAERLIVEMCPLLSDNGIETDVLVLNNKKTAFLTELKNRAKNNVLSVGGDGSIYNPLIVFKIREIIKDYDILHVHLFPAFYWAFFAKMLSFKKIKFIYTEHNTFNRRRSHSFLKHIDRFIYKRVDKIISITSSVEENLKEFLSNYTEDKFHVINNGVNLNKFKSNQKINKHVNKVSRDRKFKLLQVSSFSPQKDQKTLIRSLLLLPEYVSLELVGGGALVNECKDLVKKLGLTERVFFLGLRSDVPEIINAADVVIQSSFWEGFGLAAVEGMASGKPVIVSAVAGLREIVENYGLLFEVSNPENLAEKIRSLLHNAEYYKHIAEKCFNRSRDFSIEKMLGNYIKVYQGVEINRRITRPIETTYQNKP